MIIFVVIIFSFTLAATGYCFFNRYSEEELSLEESIKRNFSKRTYLSFLKTQESCRKLEKLLERLDNETNLSR